MYLPTFNIIPNPNRNPLNQNLNSKKTILKSPFKIVSRKSSSPKVTSSRKSQNSNLISMQIKSSWPQLSSKTWKAKKCQHNKKKAFQMSSSTLINGSVRNFANKPHYKNSSVQIAQNFKNRAGFMKSFTAKVKMSKHNFPTRSSRADMRSSQQ
jgi:hypothetical protein